MAEIGRWHNHIFEVSPSIIRSFTELQIRGASETEEKDDGGEKYVSRKNARPIEVSFSIALNALVGCDVQSEALTFVEEARAGNKDYFYIGNKKLFTHQLMLTDATVNQVEIAPGGKWIRANVQVTMKQCGKPATMSATNDGYANTAVASSGGGVITSKKVSVQQTKTTASKTVASALLSSTVSATNSAAAAIERIKTEAKTVTIARTVSGSGGGGKTVRALR